MAKLRSVKLPEEFERLPDGEWTAPKRRGYRIARCDCGLAHRLSFRLIKYAGGKRIIFQAFRDPDATRSLRSKNAKLVPKRHRALRIN